MYTLLRIHCSIDGISISENLPVWGFMRVMGWKKADMSICPSLSFSSEGMKQKSALNACFTMGCDEPKVNPMISLELVDTHTVPSSV